MKSSIDQAAEPAPQEQSCELERGGEAFPARELFILMEAAWVPEGGARVLFALCQRGVQAPVLLGKVGKDVWMFGTRCLARAWPLMPWGD